MSQGKAKRSAKGNSGFELKGRGILGSLISSPATETTSPQANSSQVVSKLSSPQAESAADWIALEKIHPSEFQPRQFFAENSINSLAASFQESGFKGAINVRLREDGDYEIVAGERRWRAAQQAGLKEVRCIVDAYSDEAALEFALVENLQREDLSKLEETEAILQLIEMKLGLERATVIHVIRTEGHPDKTSRSDVAPNPSLQQISQILSHFNIELQTFRTKNLRTLSLPDDLKTAHLQQGLSYSAAIELSKLRNPAEREALLAEVLDQQLSFRTVKERVRDLNQDQAAQIKPGQGDAEQLIDRLQCTVKQAKKASHLLQQARKRKRLEKLITELEALLAEEGHQS